MVRKLFAGILAAAWCATPLVADGPVGPGDVPVDAPVDVPIAMLLGKPITVADLRAEIEGAGIDSVGFADWGDVLREAVVHTLKARHIEQAGLHALPSEMDAFLAMLASFDASMRQSCAQSAAAMRAELESSGMSEEDRIAVEDQVAQLERSARGERWPDADARAQFATEAEVLRHRLVTENLPEPERARIIDALAYLDRYAGLSEEQAKIVYEREEAAAQRSMAIVAIEEWKFNAAMFQQYGGRVLLDRDPPEAYDATRMWLEARETAGDFVILDESVRDGFWAYYIDGAETQATGAPAAATAFARAWWEPVPAE